MVPEMAPLLVPPISMATAHATGAVTSIKAIPTPKYMIANKLSLTKEALMIQIPATNKPTMGTMRRPHFLPHRKQALSLIQPPVKQPIAGLGVSNTIRAAVANWSKTLANELGGHGITVNNVLPGATNTQRLTEIASVKANKTGESVTDILTEMGQESPMKRIAEPEEVAAAVAFLVSAEASYINGINLPVDGGRTKSL